MNVTMKQREMRAGYLMIAPVTVGLFILYIIPFFNNLRYSFSKIKDFGQGLIFVGIKNYKRILTDRDFTNSLLNTIEYVVIVLLFGICISLIIAALLHRNIRFKNIYRTIYFLPFITMPTVVALVFGLIFNDNFGLINNILMSLGIGKIPWYSSPIFAKIAIALVLIWQSVGYNILFFVAGMQAIPPTYYEAAQIDGGSAIKNFLFITLPLLSPSIFFIVVIQTINIFQVFDVVFLMFEPTSSVYQSVSTVGTYYYQTAFVNNDKGEASAAAIILFIVLLSVTLLQFWYQKKWVNYDV